MLVEVSEVNRRQNHINQVDPDHSLLPIALDCLVEKDSKRPSAQQLCERIADLKEKIKYIDSDRSIQDKDQMIQSLTARVEEKEHTMASKEEENQQLKQQIQERDGTNRHLEERTRQLHKQLQLLQQESNEVVREKGRQLQESEKQLGHVKQQLKANEKVITQLETQIAKLKHTASSTEKENQRLREKERELTNRQLVDKERQLTSVVSLKHQHEASEHVIAQFERQVAECHHTVLSVQEENHQLRQQLQQGSNGANRELEGEPNQQQGLLQQAGDKQVEKEEQHFGRENQQLGQASGENGGERELENLQLEASEQTDYFSKLERQISDTEEHFRLSQIEHETSEANSEDNNIELTSIKLRWREGKRHCAQ